MHTTLHFENLRHPEDYDGLPYHLRSQLDRIAALFEDGRTPAKRLLHSDAGASESSFGGFVDLWDLTDGATTRYEFWLYAIDWGSIFVAGTDVLAARLFHGQLCDYDDPAFARAFRDAIGEARPRFRWPERRNPWPNLKLPDEEG